jgi:excisionase family DNA binding protein
MANHAAAVQTKIAAVQSRVAARLMEERSASFEGEDDRLVTALEAARCLQYRLAYVYQLVRENRLPAKREGRKIRIRRSSLKAYMRDNNRDSVDRPLSSTYSTPHEGKGTTGNPEAFGAYPSRIRGSRRRRAELTGASGTGGDRNPRAVGSSGSADREPADVREGGQTPWEDRLSTASTTGRSETTTG